MSDPSAEPLPSPVVAGDRAPDFELPAVAPDGSQITVGVPEALAQGPIVLVFYQDDGMPICTRELNVFAQEHEALRAAGVQVFGINTNGLGSHAKFHERDHFPFALISDFHGDTVKAYGFWDAQERKSRRAVVVIGIDGGVVYSLPHYNPGNVNGVVEVFTALGLA